MGMSPPGSYVNTDQSITIDAIDQSTSVEFQIQAELIMPVIYRSDQIVIEQSFKLSENYLEQAFIPSNANNNEENVFQRNKHYARNYLKEWVTNYWYPLKYPIKV
jgi:hypothetical protein